VPFIIDGKQGVYRYLTFHLTLPGKQYGEVGGGIEMALVDGLIFRKMSPELDKRETRFKR